MASSIMGEQSFLDRSPTRWIAAMYVAAALGFLAPGVKERYFPHAVATLQGVCHVRVKP